MRAHEIYKHTYKALLLLLVGIGVTGCVTPRRVNYLQDMTHGSQIEIENRFEATIAPYDELAITVISSSAHDKELAEPFNQENLSTYLVDVNGDIEMPTLGKIHVAGLTRLNLQEELTNTLRDGGYMTNPFVNVRFSNFKVFCLVGGEGQVLNITNERCTFLEALAMMNGLDPYVQRDHIAVMREVNGRMVMRYLDPRSSDIFDDPFFMLQQNDFIIAPTYNTNTLIQNFSIWSSLVGTIASVASLVTTILLYRSMVNQ